MTLRQLIRSAIDGGEMDREVMVRVLKRGEENSYIHERWVPIARVSTLLHGERVMIVIEEADLDAAEKRTV